MKFLPDVPTLAEFVPGFEANLWLGIGAPRSTPTEIVNKLNTEINGALADPRIKARFAELGYAPMRMTPADFGKVVENDFQRWAKVVKFSGVKPD